MSSKLDEYRDALKKIEDSPEDRLGILGEVGIVGIGMAGGAIVGSTVVIPGVSTIAGSTMAASLLGGVAVVTNPVTVVAAVTLASGFVVWKLSQLVWGGGASDTEKKQIMQKLKEQIEKEEKRAKKLSTTDEKISILASIYGKLIDIGKINEKQAKLLLDQIREGNIDYDLALKNAKEMLGR